MKYDFTNHYGPEGKDAIALDVETALRAECSG